MTGDRGQAYTLEGVIGSLFLLTAILFALQSVIITPTTSGTVDANVRAELRAQADDVLVIASQNESFGLGSLSRYWHQSDLTFFNATNPRVGYGSGELPGDFGEMLNETFTSRSRLYNIELRYPAKEAGKTLSTTVAYQGQPSKNAVTASYTVTLYDNQTLTSPTASSAVELWQYDTDPTDNDDGYYPIPNAVPGPVYNVVEVRLTVW